jgi:hypothetical protein
MEALRKLEAAAESISSMPSDEETADYLGRLDFVIKKLSAHRSAVLLETPGPLAGREYRVIESRSAARSYNDAALFRSFQAAGWTLEDLLAARAVSYQWHWTELHRSAIAADFGLRLAGHELVDGDEADHVGEVWKSKLSIEAVDK